MDEHLSPFTPPPLPCGLSGERGAQGRRYLGRRAALHDDDGHRAFNRELPRGVEDLVVVAYGGAAELAYGEEQAERRVEFEDALELTFQVDAREVVGALAQVQGAAQAPQKLALGLLDDLEDAREVQAAGRVRVGPAEAAVELYLWRRHVCRV